MSDDHDHPAGPATKRGYWTTGRITVAIGIGTLAIGLVGLLWGTDLLGAGDAATTAASTTTPSTSKPTTTVPPTTTLGHPPTLYLESLTPNGSAPDTVGQATIAGTGFNHALTYKIQCCTTPQTLSYSLPAGYSTFHAALGTSDTSQQNVNVQVVVGTNTKLFEQSIAPGHYVDTGQLDISAGPRKLTFVLTWTEGYAPSLYPAIFIAGDPAVS
jgi:hypothetical protein